MAGPDPRSAVPTTAELDTAVGSPACVPGPHRCALGAGVDRAAGTGTGVGRRGRIRRAATACRPMRTICVRAQARGLLTAAQRVDARTAALDSFAAAGVVAVHECAGPDIGGRDDWDELRRTAHGVEVTGYWGEAVRTADEARGLIEATGARGLAGDLFVDGALGSHTAWLHGPLFRCLRVQRQLLPRCARDRLAPAGLHGGRDHARDSTSSAMRRWARWSTPASRWSTDSVSSRWRAAGIGSSISRWSATRTPRSWAPGE